MRNSTRWAIASVILIGGLVAIFGKVRQDGALAAEAPATAAAATPDPWQQFLGPDKMEPAAGDDELQTLLKARFNAAVALVKARTQNVASGRASWESVVTAYGSVREAWIGVHDTPADEVRAWEFYAAMAKKCERECTEMVRVGRFAAAELPGVTYLRSDAEVKLLLAQRSAAGKHAG